METIRCDSPRGKRFLLVCLVSFGVVGLTGCATHSKTVQSAVDLNDEKMETLIDRVKDQDAKIEKLTATIDDLTHQMSKKMGPVSFSTRTTGGKNEPREVVGVLEGTLPVQKLSPVESEPMVDEDQKPAEENDGTATVADSTQESMHWYFDGLRMMEEKKYDDAVHSFRQFLSESPDHVYADHAEYWIAESYFRNREYSLAVMEANGMESRYPFSLRMPDALMMRGLSYKKMGQATEARDEFHHLLIRFPESEAANEASHEIATLDLPSKEKGNVPVLIDEPN